MNTVKIGNQEWTQENLNIGCFQNGDLIQHAKSKEEWKDAFINKQPAWCFHYNEQARELKSGRLYNFYTILDSRIISPSGFHIPSIEEWETLINFLGGYNEAGLKLKSINGFNGTNPGATNESGFTAVAGGERGSGGSFYDPEHHSGRWWSNTQINEESFYIGLESRYGEVLKRKTDFGSGLSIRCLKNQ